jgi:hypothetical protein
MWQHPCGIIAARNLVERLLSHSEAEVRHMDGIAFHHVLGAPRPVSIDFVTHDLVTIEAEVDPPLSRPPFR